MMKPAARRLLWVRAALVAVPVVVLAAYAPFAGPVLRSRVFRAPLDQVGGGQCFSARQVDLTRPCARCVHFVTVVNVANRWGSADRLAQGLHVTAGALRASQRCFTLYAYTNAARGSPAWKQLAAAGGKSVTVRPYPEDLPTNAYSGRRPWLELSRRKLDLLERYEGRYGRKAIWTDVDTIVAADLACAYARAPNFIISRQKKFRAMWGPRGNLVWLDDRRSVFGDLFMLDARLIARVRDLEARGMPPPVLDLQDYFSYLLNRCDGSVVDLRAMVREDGFMKGRGSCIAFDFAQGQHPTPDITKLKMVNGSLHCGVEIPRGDLEYHKVGTMSFTADTFWKMLDAPDKFFPTPELKKWATAVGISFPKTTPAVA